MRCSEGGYKWRSFQMGTITHHSKEKSLSHICFMTLEGITPPSPIHLYLPYSCLCLCGAVGALLTFGVPVCLKKKASQKRSKGSRNVAVSPFRIRPDDTKSSVLWAVTSAGLCSAGSDCWPDRLSRGEAFLQPTERLFVTTGSPNKRVKGCSCTNACVIGAYQNIKIAIYCDI